MQLRQALSDIAEIRQRMDQTETYRGFRSVAIGISGVFVLLGAIAQGQAGSSGWFQSTFGAKDGYLRIWLFVALASLVVTAVEMLLRGVISSRTGVWRMHRRLVFLLSPSLIAGAVLTAVICINRDVNDVATNQYWILPGMWAVVYGLGLVSCCLHLHRSTFWAATYYLIAGGIYFYLNWTTRELAAWHMVAIFGTGQLLLGGLLYWHVERKTSG